MKITASTVLNIVLSVVLLSSLFYVGVTSSIAVYDPYADYDQDGDIDIFDVVPMADAYGTTGDSTRNVTVTNFPYKPPKTIVYENIVTDLSYTGHKKFLTVNVEGYGFLSIAFQAQTLNTSKRVCCQPSIENISFPFMGGIYEIFDETFSVGQNYTQRHFHKQIVLPTIDFWIYEGIHDPPELFVFHKLIIYLYN